MLREMLTPLPDRSCVQVEELNDSSVDICTVHGVLGSLSWSNLPPGHAVQITDWKSDMVPGLQLVQLV